MHHSAGVRVGQAGRDGRAVAACLVPAEPATRRDPVQAVAFHELEHEDGLAAILEGVFARYSAGQYGQTSDEFRSFGKIVEQLADAALDAARRLE